MKNWISFPRVEGSASRQAHADLPEGTYERELGKEGFAGPVRMALFEAIERDQIERGVLKA